MVDMYTWKIYIHFFIDEKNIYSLVWLNLESLNSHRSYDYGEKKCLVLRKTCSYII